LRPATGLTLNGKNKFVGKADLKIGHYNY